MSNYQQQFLQLFACFLDSLGVCRVNDIDKCISVCEIVAPILPQCFLSSDVPHVEFELVMCEVLDVEALRRRDGGDVLIEGKGTSLESDLRMVVFPELSSPSTKMRSYYFLFFLRLRRMPISPPACVDIQFIIVTYLA